MQKEKLVNMMKQWPASDVETLTTHVLAKDMVENIPEEYLRNKKSKFIDIACGKGSILLELYEKLVKYHSSEYIIENMLFGMDISELQVLNALFFLEKRSGIRSKNIIKGNSLEHKWNIRFDVILMNPPYQNSIKDKGGNDQQIYHKFVVKAIEMNPKIICAITPSRWFISENMKDYRNYLTKDNHIKKMVVYQNSKECFSNVSIEGGVSYFIWDKKHEDKCNFINIANGEQISSKQRFLGEYDTIIRNNDSVSILEKVKKQTENTFDSLMFARNPFGLQTNFFKNHPYELTPTQNHVKIYTNHKHPDMWIQPEIIQKNSNIIDKYKVIITKAYGGVYTGSKPMPILNTPIIAKPNEICSDSYIICAVFDKLEEAENCVSYINTKFFRFMVSLIKITQDNSRNVFKFVPLVDFNEVWDDNKLKHKFSLTDEEVDYMDSQIRLTT